MTPGSGACSASMPVRSLRPRGTWRRGSSCRWPTAPRAGADAAREDRAGASARITTGYCWPWSDAIPGHPLVDDIVIGDWRRPWSVKGNRAVNGLPPSPCGRSSLPVPTKSAASTPRKASSTTTAASSSAPTCSGGAIGGSPTQPPPATTPSPARQRPTSTGGCAAPTACCSPGTSGHHPVLHRPRNPRPAARTRHHVAEKPAVVTGSGIPARHRRELSGRTTPRAPAAGAGGG